MEAHEAAGQPRRGAARVRGPARAAARGARHDPRPGRDGASTSASCSAGRRRARAPAPRVPSGRRWPAPLDAVRAGHAFVGRSAEAAALEATLARRGRRRAPRSPCSAGDAGIGKTRLAAELAALAHDDGAVVLYGRFDEEAPAPYQPVVQMLRGWAGGASLAPFAAAARRRAPPSSGSSCRSWAPPARARRRRCAAPSRRPAAAALRRDRRAAGRDRGRRAAARRARRPALGRSADAPAARATSSARRRPSAALFLATARARRGRARRSPALLAGLRREGRSSGSTSAGLDAGETAALVDALGGAAADARVRRRAARGDRGQPVLHRGGRPPPRRRRRATSRWRDAGVPDGVREVTGAAAGAARRARARDARRSRRWSARGVRLRRARGGRRRCTATRWSRRSRRRSRAGVLREDRERVGRYAFSHALMRATLYDGLSALRRARLHSRVGEALIARRGAQLDPHLGQLAHHFALAAPVDRPERAVDFALAAGPPRRPPAGLGGGGRALPRGAARARAGRRGRGPAALRAAARARRLAGARGRRGDAQRRSRRRRDGARRSATPALLGRAALGYAGPLVAARPRRGGRRGAAPGGARRARRRGRRRCARGCSPGSRSSSTTPATPSGGSRSPRRRSRSPAGSATRSTLAACLDARHYALWRPETVQERLEVASELRRIAEAVGDPELELEGAGWTVVDLLELGDVAGADIQIAAASRLAAALHRPLYEWWTSLFRCARAQIDGRFDEAERLADETLAIGQRGQAENAIARLRAGDVQHPPRAGPARRGRGGRARVHRACTRRCPPGAARSRCC